MKAYKLRRRVRDGGFLHRILTIRVERRRWWDWGHMMMTLVGQYRTGTYEVPRGRDLWYRFADDNEARGRIIKTHAYADVRALPNASWKVLDVQDEGGTVMMGWWGDRITFYGLTRRELALFRRWDFWECRARGEWFGLRRWLYYRGLHAAVHRRIPFTCQKTPPRGSGGYSHWHCELRGKHSVHRFGNYTWAENTPHVEYAPDEGARGRRSAR
jgi:hypothetical protein